MKQEYHFIANTIKLIGSTLVVYLFIKVLLPVVFPFFVAFFLAGVLHPLKQRWIAREKTNHDSSNGKKKNQWKNSVVTVLLLALVVFVIGGGILLLGVLLINQIKELWQQRSTWIHYLQELLDQMSSGLGERMVQQWKEKFSVDEMIGGLAEKIMSQAAKGIQLLKGTFGGFINLVVTLVSAFLLLKDYDFYHKKIMESPLGEVILALGSDLKKVGGSYLKAQLVIMGIVMGECVLGMVLIGNSYALLAGILIGICDALPFLGTAVVFLPWAVITFIQGNVLQGILLIILTGITTITRQYLEPKLIGSSIGANPFLVLVSIYLGIQAFGMWGFLLGPVAAFLIWEMYQFL